MKLFIWYTKLFTASTGGTILIHTCERERATFHHTSRTKPADNSHCHSSHIIWSYASYSQEYNKHFCFAQEPVTMVSLLLTVTFRPLLKRQKQEELNSRNVSFRPRSVTTTRSINIGNKNHTIALYQTHPAIIVWKMWRSIYQELNKMILDKNWIGVNNEDC